MNGAGWVCSACTFHNEAFLRTCSMCGTLQRGQWQFSMISPHGNNTLWAERSSGQERTFPSFSICSIPRLLAGAICGALTGVFAIVGAFTGAVTGALAGRAADSGLLRGAGLGAVAGAVLSVEVFEASRAYWCSDHSGSHSLLSMAEFIEDLLNGRFVQEQFAPAMQTAHRWQVSIAEMTYDELYEMFGPGEGGTKGASETVLANLPYHTVTPETKMDLSGQAICCAICLQELQQGEIARRLPLCHHTFHMTCVDTWLTKHGSCPVCRQYI
eukprot:c25153_g3_i1 orf=472-1284(+)